MSYNCAAVVMGNTVGDTWVRYLRTVIKHGEYYHDEGERILELEDAVLCVEDDTENDPILEKYADMHLKELYLKKMQSTEIVKELNASYGKRIYDQLGVNQYQWCYERLKNKPESKAATMSLLLPDDPGPRIPCLNIIDFKLRNDVLYTKTFFRSQNAMNAYGNLCALFWLSGNMARDLNVKRGNLTCFIANGHIYEDRLSNAEQIVSSFEGKLWL
jgi:thymidylate synthase|nr:thymidylate synthase [uncultured Acetatifactor sp.]